MVLLEPEEHADMRQSKGAAALQDESDFGALLGWCGLRGKAWHRRKQHHTSQKASRGAHRVRDSTKKSHNSMPAFRRRRTNSPILLSAPLIRRTGVTQTGLKRPFALAIEVERR